MILTYTLKNNLNYLNLFEYLSSSNFTDKICIIK